MNGESLGYERDLQGQQSSDVLLCAAEYGGRNTLHLICGQLGWEMEWPSPRSLDVLDQIILL